MGNTVSYMLGGDAPAPTIPQPDDPALKKQTVVVEGTGDWGSGAHISTACKDGRLFGIEENGLDSLHSTFMQGVADYPDNPCLGWRPVVNGVVGDYKFITYREVAEWAMDIGSGIRQLGLKRGDYVGLYSKNCVEWLVVEQACNAFTHPTVAIYDTFGNTAVRYIIEHSEQSLVFVEEAKLPLLIAAVETGTPQLKHVVCFGAFVEGDVERLKAYGVSLMSMDSLRSLGQAHRQKADPPKQDDVAIIMYTSGTMGDPKGVVLTHFNMVSTINAVCVVIKVLNTDVYMSFLPLAHCFERVIVSILLRSGAQVGLYQGDVHKLTDDIRTLRPTLFVGVPRIFNRFHEKVLQAVEDGGLMGRQLYYRAYAYRKAALARGQDTPLLNYVLFDKLRAAMGGRVRLMVSGSAPLDTRVHEWMRVCMCPIFMQGYGLTETCAATAVQIENDLTLGSIGPPLPANEFKLGDVPDMGYLTTDNPPRGELLVRGNSVFKCYFKDPKRTMAEKDSDGWFHTGDIGSWNENGSISIIDRKKNIFKMAQGEYIAVETLEMVYTRSQYVSQVYVYGDSLKTFLLALVVPDHETLMPWAAANGVEGDFATVCEHPDVKALLERDMWEEAKKAQLKGFEIIKGIIVHSEPFSVENELLTPTHKIRRPIALKRFKMEFQALYEEIEARMK